MPRKLLEYGYAAAPDDLPLYELALRWHYPPHELRQWSVDDLYWMQTLELAQALAAPIIHRRAAERAAKKAKT